MNNEQMQVVVARYREDISWTEKLKFKTIIYNKYSEENEFFEYNLPNVGREGHTFFTHIVNNYENLSEYTAFLQGSPFDHCPDIVEILNAFDFSCKFKPLGKIATLENILPDTPLYGVRRQVELYGQAIGFLVRFPLSMVAGGQYIIKKDVIYKNSLDFYKKIVDSLSKEEYPQAGLDVEKTLFQIYRFYDLNSF